MKIVIALLYLVAAVLPTIAFLRLLRRSGRALDEVEALVLERGFTHTPWDDFDDQNARDIREVPRQLKSDSVREAWLVGGGLLCGAVASIWSLFL